jgi:hypothetical protein
VIELSLNEVEGIAAKAARGAGLDWGLAEDVGRAARRLAAAGLDWTGPVLALEQDAAPACLGAELGDRPDGPDQALSLETANPLLVAALAAASPAARMFNWPGSRLDAAKLRLVARQGPQGRDGAPVSLVVARLADPPCAAAPSRRSRIAPAAMEALQRLVHETYVPESDRSKARGAGSSRSDND